MWQVRIGVALIGLSGDEMIVEREKRPKQFWFAIMVQTLVGIVFPILTGIALAVR